MEIINHRQHAAEQIMRDRYFRHLEHRVARVSNDLRADLHHLLAQRGQRPSLDLIGQSQKILIAGQNSTRLPG